MNDGIVILNHPLLHVPTQLYDHIEDEVNVVYGGEQMHTLQFFVVFRHQNRHHHNSYRNYKCA